MRERLVRLAASLVHRRVVPLPPGMRPGVSFTFDDFPASAVERAGGALEAAGMRGTWYLAAGLLGRETEVGRVVSRDEAGALRARGHEIGCHTFSHLRAAGTGAERYAEDLDANQAALRGLLPGPEDLSFSFPFGDFTAATKGAAAARAGSCRTTMAGIARGEVDLNALPANPIYEEAYPLESVLDRVRDVASGGGWLILYTHDVTERPSPWGCSPGYFLAVVEAVAAAGLEVRPVGAVVSALREGA